MDHAVEQSVEAIVDPIRRSMKRELFNLTQPVLDLGKNSANPIVSQAALVHHSPKITDMTRSNAMMNAIELCTLHPGLPAAALASTLTAASTAGAGAGPAALAAGIGALGAFPKFDGDSVFDDKVFGANLFVNKNLQLVNSDDTQTADTVMADLGENIVIETPQESTGPNTAAKITVPINGPTGEMLELELLPADTDSDGNLIYTDNYNLNLTIKDALGVKDLETIQLVPKDNQLPDALINHLQDYNLDPNSPNPPQAQYFSEHFRKSKKQYWRRKSF